MRIIEIQPTTKFGGGWIAFEAPGVEPAFPGPSAKSDAISYARGRFGGSSGEIHVLDDKGETIVKVIKMDGGGQYGQART
ncbi:MAG TPA: hypothetical protein VGI60_02680 [Chthoniobacterales bacterium]|jgi:hypothetical protein